MVFVRRFTRFVSNSAEIADVNAGEESIDSKKLDQVWIFIVYSKKTIQKPHTPFNAPVELASILNGLEGQVGNSPIYLFKVRK